MNLAFSSSAYYPCSGKTANGQVRLFRPVFSTTRKFFRPKTFTCLASIATPETQAYDIELEDKKHILLSAIQETQRGLSTTADQRSYIEESLVNVEAYNMSEPIDLVKLDGTWRLQYTSAPDVLVLLEAAARLPFFQVGQIFQKFECHDQTNGGIIRNIVRWSIPNLLEDQEGATLLVSAKFSVVSARNIYLQFQEITLQDLIISEELQAIIAPAILPRSFLSLQIICACNVYESFLALPKQLESLHE